MNPTKNFLTKRVMSHQPKKKVHCIITMCGEHHCLRRSSRPPICSLTLPRLSRCPPQPRRHKVRQVPAYQTIFGSEEKLRLKSFHSCPFTVRTIQTAVTAVGDLLSHGIDFDPEAKQMATHEAETHVVSHFINFLSISKGPNQNHFMF